MNDNDKVRHRLLAIRDELQLLCSSITPVSYGAAPDIVVTNSGHVVAELVQARSCVADALNHLRG